VPESLSARQRAAVSFGTDTFFVRRFIGGSPRNALEILSASGRPVGSVVDETPFLQRVAGMFYSGKARPFVLKLYDDQKKLMASIERPALRMTSRINVYEAAGWYCGCFRYLPTLSGGMFEMFNETGKYMIELVGEWDVWNFKLFAPKDETVGLITRQWTGVAKELFTSADNYIFHVDRNRIRDARHVLVLLSTALTMELIYRAYVKSPRRD
jgi:hypothetical protein